MPVEYYCKKCQKKYTIEEYKKNKFCRDCGTFLSPEIYITKKPTTSGIRKKPRAQTMTEENKTLTEFYPVYYIKDKDYFTDVEPKEECKHLNIDSMRGTGVGRCRDCGEAVTVNPSPVNIRNGVGYSGGGAAHRLIVDFSNISNSRTCISGGQSGLSTSKHYADQLEQLFLQGKHHYTYIQHTPATFPSNIIESIIILKPPGE